jgi:hypothetical protein
VTSLTRLRLLCLCLIAGSLFARDSAPVDACGVFWHPDRFLGKTVRVRAVYLVLIHGMYMFGYPKCEGVEIPFAVIREIPARVMIAWRQGGGSRGVWMLCDVVGRFDRSANGGFWFDAESLSVVRKVKPYDLTQGHGTPRDYP